MLADTAVVGIATGDRVVRKAKFRRGISGTRTRVRHRGVSGLVLRGAERRGRVDGVTLARPELRGTT